MRTASWWVWCTLRPVHTAPWQPPEVAIICQMHDQRISTVVIGDQNTRATPAEQLELSESTEPTSFVQPLLCSSYIHLRHRQRSLLLGFPHAWGGWRPTLECRTWELTGRSLRRRGVQWRHCRRRVRCRPWRWRLSSIEIISNSVISIRNKIPQAMWIGVEPMLDPSHSSQ